MESSKSDTTRPVLEYLVSTGCKETAEEFTQQQKLDNLSSSSSSLASQSNLISTSLISRSSGLPGTTTSSSVNPLNANGGTAGNGNQTNSTESSSLHTAIISNFKEDLVIFGIHKGDSREYSLEYERIRNWAYESIDLVKDELMAICFILFVHCHLGLFRLKEEARASEFWTKYSIDYRHHHPDELSELANILTLETLQSEEFLVSNDFIREVLKSKFQITISEISYNLLTSYLLQNNSKLISTILNDKITFEPRRAHPSSYEQVIVLPNYNSVKQANTANTSTDLPIIHWAVPGTGELLEHIPMFASIPEYFHGAMPNTKDDKTYLEWIEKIMRPKLLLGEPLPTLSKLSVSGMIGKDVADPLEPTIAFASVMNTYEGMTSMNISSNFTQIATGYQDSSIRIFRLDYNGNTFQDSLSESHVYSSSHIHNNNSNSSSGGNLSSSIAVSGSSSYSSSSSRPIPYGRVLLNYTGVDNNAMNTILPIIPNYTQHQDIDDLNSSSIGTNGILDLKGHSGPIYAIDQDSTERLIISGSSDEYVRLWDTQVAQCVGKYHIESPIWDVKFSPMGYYFISANMDHSLRLYSIDRKFPLRIIIGHQRDVNSCCWHDNLTLIASASDDKSARLWDIRAPTNPVRIFRGSSVPLNSVQCSPFGNLIAAGSDVGTIRLWDVGTGKTLAILPNESKTFPVKNNVRSLNSSVYSIAFSPSSEVLSAGYSDCSVKIWDLRGLKSTIHAISKHPHLHPPPFDEYILKPKHIFRTKFTPVYHIRYTTKNLLLAGGPFSLDKATGYTSLDTSLASASEKEAITALGLSHPVPSI